MRGGFRHLRNYASAGLLSALVGVVSFPIMTRNLSVADYGLLGLIASSLTLFVAFGKLGVQHSVIRFFAQIREGNSAFDTRQMNSTVGALFLVFAAATTLVWLLVGNAVLPHLLRSEKIGALFGIAAGVVFVRLLGSGILNFLRAQQRSAVVALSQMIARVVNLALIVALLLLVGLDLRSLLVCLLLAELASVAHAAWRYRADFVFDPRALSMPLARALLAYGVPLMLLESLGLVLRLSDRYLIEILLGVTELGQYSASYNLVAYLDVVVLAAMVQAIKPMYVQIWEGEGREATRVFLGRGLRLFLVLGLPLVALFSSASPHLLGFLAGERYAPGTVIIPWVTLSFLIDGAVIFLGAGLYIHKDTRTLVRWGAAATAVNLALNVALIPHFGIVGAAVVTVLSYLLFGVGVARAAFGRLPFALPLREPVLMGLAAVAVYLALERVELGSDPLDFLAKSALGACALGAALLAVDAETRGWLLARWPGAGRPGTVE